MNETAGKKVIDCLPLRQSPRYWQCPFCLKPVGLVGRGLAYMVGVGVHGCRFTNVMHPQEFANWKQSRASNPTP
jgi:hypothetical protein